MDWTATFNAQDKSIDDLMARRQLEQNGLLKILAAGEDLRQNRANEQIRTEDLADRKAWREDQIAQRREAQIERDNLMRAQAAKAQGDADKQAAIQASWQKILNDPTADKNLQQAIRFKMNDINPTANVQTGTDPMALAAARSQAQLSNAMALLIKRDQLGDENAKTRPGKSGAVTPAQKMAAHLQAMRMAAAAGRDGQIPPGMEQEEYAKQLEMENLAAAGVEVNPEDAQWRGKAHGTTGDIDLDAGVAAPTAAPVAPGPPQDAGDAKALAFLNDQNKKRAAQGKPPVPITPANIAAVKQKLP